MSAPGEAAWKQQQQQQQQQQQLEQDSTSRGVIQGAIAGGGDVCVWDAFGAYWCERKTPLAGGYVRRATQQGRPVVYEGFCGCGADSMD